MDLAENAGRLTHMHARPHTHFFPCFILPRPPPGLPQIQALQQYSVASGYQIIVNQRLARLVSSAPRHRLVAVDVLCFKETCASDGQKRQGELVYQCVGALDAQMDEWMYELQVRSWSQGLT